jgi:hypothetical protein
VSQWAQGAAEVARREGEAQAAVNIQAIEGLEVQRRAIEANTQASREWLRIAESAQQLIDELMLGNISPLTPREALAYAESRLSISEAALAADATPENAMAVQEAIQGVLAAGQNVWTRPSDEWDALFTSMTDKLEALRADAAARVTPEEQAAASLVSIDEQIRTLQAKNEAIARNTESQIAAIDAAAKAEAAEINAGLGGIMGQIAEEQARLLGLLIAQQEEIQASITGGLSPLEFQLEAARVAAIQLYDIRALLYAALTGEDVPAPTPLQTGADYVSAGVYRLHEGEAVLDPEDADRWRRSRYAVPAATHRSGTTGRAERGGGGTMTVNFHPGAIVIHGVSDPERASDLAVAKVDRLLRTKWRERFVQGRG